jgi:exosome complex component CSL4
VISLGDTNSYFLSCAENELGVVIAYSESGNFFIITLYSETNGFVKMINFFLKGVRMVPISWNEMQCPVTMQKEYRKVAKVHPEFLEYIEQTNDETNNEKSMQE